MARKTLTQEERFLKYVSPEPNSGCWLWTGAASRWDSKVVAYYGFFSLNKRLTNAHRAAWILFLGEIPSGMCVLHKCDVPLCVNPDHLFLGTQKDNMQDKIAKKRGRRSSFGYPRWVRRRPKGGKFGAELVRNGVRFYVGTFDTPEEAGEAADRKFAELLAQPT